MAVEGDRRFGDYDATPVLEDKGVGIAASDPEFFNFRTGFSRAKDDQDPAFRCQRQRGASRLKRKGPRVEQCAVQIRENDEPRHRSCSRGC